MTGTFINVGAVVAGGLLGSILGDKLSTRIQEIVMWGIGLVVFAVGIDMAIKSNNILIVLGSILLGSILGEWWQIQKRLDSTGNWLEAKVQKFPFLTRGEFTRGFVTASLVFCVGPMTILGSIQDGLSGDFTLLTIKSVLDGFAALAFAAAMGMGVTFSAVAILLIQGSITLGAGLFDSILTEAMITELSATGGVMLLGISLILLDIKKIRVANFLPALALAPLLLYLWEIAGLK